VKTFAVFCGALLAFVAAGRSQEVLDRLNDALTLSAWHDNARARFSGLIDAEGYYFEHPAPGLIDATERFLFNPRLTLFLDTQIGPQIYFFAQARLDRGFDPSNHGAQFRLDEYALRFTPWEDGRLSVQLGMAAAVFGGWINRHLSWDNPFVNAPLPYENVTAASDETLPVSAHGFGLVETSEKYEYLPIIWGPSYTTGLTLSGRLGRFDYAAEIKNAALSSRPESWSATEIGFDHPAFNGRLGFRPDLAWNFGVSVSEGAYLRPEVESELPAGQGIDDYRQFVIGQDVSYAIGRWQLWAECFESRFEIPRVGNLDAFSYYLEAKYKFTPQLFGALRWNQQVFSAVEGEVSSRDTRRLDAALSYRFTPHIQLKLQYSFQDGSSLFGDGSTVATQLTVRF
jgi:hypothetical protein